MQPRRAAPTAPQLVVSPSLGGSSGINSARLRAAEPSDRLECSHKRLTCGLSKHAQQGSNVGDSRREDVLDESDGGRSDFNA